LIEEEEIQIRFQLAEEELTFGPSGDCIALQDMGYRARAKSASAATTPTTTRHAVTPTMTRHLKNPPKRGGSFDKLNLTIKSLLGNGNNNVQLKKEEKSEIKEVVANKTPSSYQLEQMKLKDGENTIKFITAITKQAAFARIFLWKPKVKVIISDIDGTITKTDKRGLFFYKFGYDWTHDSVVEFYQKLACNGYQFVYLTARSVKVQNATRTYLEKINVPKDPILCAPHNLFACVTTEFWKTTAAGKLMHLKAIRNLFPEDSNPFIAGFGNRIHDHVAYKEIGVSPEKIFIVNKQSEISVDGKKTKYDTLVQSCTSVFPCCNKELMV